MLSKMQANQIGDELIGEARSDRLDQRHRAARRIPLLYRFPELKRIEPDQRAILVEATLKAAGQQAAVRWSWFISGIAPLAIILAYGAYQGPVGITVTWSVMLLSMCPAYLYKRKVMRQLIGAHLLAAAEHKPCGSGTDMKEPSGLKP